MDQMPKPVMSGAVRPQMVEVEAFDDAATGAVFREWRESLGVTLSKCAESMGYTPPYLSDLERGRRPWSERLVAEYEAAIAKHREG